MANATVLLIDASTDDERLFREELALVRDQPFALEVARSLAEGLAQLRQRPPRVEYGATLRAPRRSHEPL